MSDEEAEQWGVLHNDAAKALMRLLWRSRLNRPDLSFIVCRLASSGENGMSDNFTELFAI